MCGRFAVNIKDLIELVEHYTILLDGVDVASSAPELIEEYYPTAQVPMLRREGERVLVDSAYWNLVPHWWSKPLAEKKFATFNAQADSLAEKATFRDAWARGRRCIVPATEFYEWPDAKMILKGQPRPRHAVSVPDQPVFSMAGIWDECRLPGEPEVLRSCAVITTGASLAMLRIPHKRMPAILRPEEVARWLDPATSPGDAAAMLALSDDIRIEKRP